MKTHFSKIVLLVFVMTFAAGCNEEEFLREVPPDFYSPENSYITEANFQAALTDLYARVRGIQSLDNNANQYSDVLGTDEAFNAREDNNRLGDYNTSITPQAFLPSYHWTQWYKVIANANTIIGRLPGSSLADAKQKVIGGEAKLFRAWAYRHLVHQYGGVPLVLNEATSPKNDYVRVSRDEVLNQIVLDATEAAANLPNVDAVNDGKLNKAVANHLLAETFISLKQYDKAIAAATEVIEKSNLSLMKTRFGSLKNSLGDVYYDLFRVGNQNRKGGGNMEAIWVVQYEVDVPGGGVTSTGISNALERAVGPAVFSMRDPKGAGATLNNASASTLNSGGRGVSFVQPTDYYLYDVWGLDPKADNRVVTKKDIRTSAFNIVRDFIYSNPQSTFFGKSLLDFPAPNWLSERWRWYPFPSKITTPGQHPAAVIDDPATLTLKSTAGALYRDMYLIRLPETLFLRAEAYLLKGDPAQAAADLNTVRSRANAEPVTPGEVTLDYILDERARELMFEENRRLTLVRMGKLVERVRKYNPLNSKNINDYNILFPIPFSEIQANTGAKLEQNPGY